MKSTAKIAGLIFVLVFLFGMTNLRAQASMQGNAPDPSFKSTAAFVQRVREPWYSQSAQVNIYRASGMYYGVETASQKVVEIEPQSMNYEVAATFTQAQLRTQARKLAAGFVGKNTNLGSLSLTVGRKIGTYFFRWEDSSKELDDGSPAFVQVGLSHNGDFLNFVNTLPFAHARGTTHQVKLIGPFNEIYANADGSVSWKTTYFKKLSGSMTATTGGYYYIYGSSVCNKSYCSTFAYTGAASGGGTSAAWYPNANSSVQASVFVPSTHATLKTTYQITRTNGTTFSSLQVDQNAFYNAWAALTLTTVSNGIKQVTLTNLGSSLYEVAWDEVWVYNP